MNQHRTSILQELFSAPWIPGLLRFVVAAGVLGLSAILGFAIGTYRAPLLIVGLLVGTLIGIVLLLRYGKSEYSVLWLLLSAGFFAFFSISTGRESRIPVSVVVALVMMGLYVVGYLIGESRHPLLRKSRLNAPVLLFVAINIIAWLWSLIFRDPLLYVWSSFPFVQMAALLIIVLLPMVALLCINTISQMNVWRVIVWATILTGLVGVYSELLRLPTDELTWNVMRGLFSAWASGLAVALLLFQKRMHWFEYVLLLAVIAGVFYRNVIENLLWLSGWIPMGVFWFLIAWFRSRKLGMLLIVGLLVFVFLNFDTLYVNIVQANIDEGGTERLGLWRMNLEHVANHPIFGMGPAGYATYNMTYHPLDARSTHNNYFDVLAQSGIVGFVSFLTLMGTALWLGWRNIQRTGTHNGFVSAFAVATFSGVAAAMVGMMLGDWVLPFAYNQTIRGFDNAVVTWIYVGGIGSLDWMLRSGVIPLQQKGKPAMDAPPARENHIPPGPELEKEAQHVFA